MFVIGPHYCPHCHQRMKKQAELGFFEAFQCELDRILQGGWYVEKWVCFNEHLPNSHGIDAWKSKYEKKLQEIEKKFGQKCRKDIEKKGFHGKMGDLEKIYGKNGKKVKNTPLSKNALDKVDQNSNIRYLLPAQNKPVSIVKKPPEYICCKNHYLYKVSGIYNETKKVRRVRLFYMWDSTTHSMIKYRPLVMRIVFPGT